MIEKLEDDRFNDVKTVFFAAIYILLHVRECDKSHTA